MVPLLKLLQSVRDVSSEEEEKEMLVKATRLRKRYAQNDQNVTIHQIKKLICEILIFITKLKESWRISEFLKCFKEDLLFQEKEAFSPSKKRKKILPEPNDDILT
jgi:hypothetical protein